MRLKSFFADSIEEAIRQARHELGPEAMLVNSKRTNVEAHHLGAYEVVVCSDPAEYAPEDADHKRIGVHPALGAPPVDQLSRDVAELRHQMEKLSLTLARSGSGMGTFAFDPGLSRAFSALMDAEFDTELAFDIVSRIASPFSVEGLQAELARLAQVDPELGCTGAASRVVALAGPPGCGKTSALVKLAVRYGVAAHKPVQILSTDTYRIGAAEELRSYASILGIGFQVLNTAAALRPALQECCHKDLVLIDTAGLARSEMEIAEEWAEALTADRSIETHLVLPASMRAADLKRVAGQYSIFQPHKLLFTRLDETETVGPILSLSIRLKKPISFFSSGQKIPEDLAPAGLDALFDRIFVRGTSLEPNEAQEPKSPEPKSSESIYGVVAA
jgi:flagellar biosynthesis protein FlhF